MEVRWKCPPTRNRGACHARRAVHADMGTNNPSEEQLDLVTDRECPP